MVSRGNMPQECDTLLASGRLVGEASASLHRGDEPIEAAELTRCATRHTIRAALLLAVVLVIGLFAAAAPLGAAGRLRRHISSRLDAQAEETGPAREGGHPHVIALFNRSLELPKPPPTAPPVQPAGAGADDADTRWEVVFPGVMNVFEKMDPSSTVVGSRWKCSEVSGKEVGNWVKLQGEPGYLKGIDAGKPLLRKLPEEMNSTCTSCANPGENCTDAACCKQAGMQCYEKDASWGSCKPSCQGGPDPTDLDSRPWSCKALGPRTAGQVPGEEISTKVRKWVKKECSKPGQNCTDSRCCSWAGMQCYQKSEAWASCKDSCMPGPDLHDYNGDQWSCKELGVRTPGKAVKVTQDIGDWVTKKCAGLNKDCSDTKCCADPGQQCFQKDANWASCFTDCIPGKGPPELKEEEEWLCNPLGPMWTMTTTTTTTTRTRGHPSLFCFSVTRSTGYEVDIIKLQQKKKAGIFSCDDYAILCSDPLTLHSDEGVEIEALQFVSAAVGLSKDGTAGNAQLFMNVWDALSTDGRYEEFAWTIKVDPDAVLIPDRLRKHLLIHTIGSKYVVNCNKPNMVPMMFGSLEAITSKALKQYFDRKTECISGLDWQPWGEDYFMGKCLDLLGVGKVSDFAQVGDGVCTGRDCSEGSRAAFHPLKSADKWLACFETATR